MSPRIYLWVIFILYSARFRQLINVPPVDFSVICKESSIGNQIFWHFFLSSASACYSFSSNLPAKRIHDKAANLCISVIGTCQTSDLTRRMITKTICSIYD
ncbi:uncharacterized protein LOC129740080 isoform X2 [Uranotaenia lowii]|uniref:uncharacterized protein LOC129740080 isoform X2 n=1 Tax=Uranotaenia lowii TaxID=190385 RepID=UPI00247A1681|nr:uncharacterized protein LOC129740080 isoform X2 [Uranotaenia lowii]